MFFVLESERSLDVRHYMINTFPSAYAFDGHALLSELALKTQFFLRAIGAEEDTALAGLCVWHADIVPKEMLEKMWQAGGEKVKWLCETCRVHETDLPGDEDALMERVMKSRLRVSALYVVIARMCVTLSYFETFDQNERKRVQRSFSVWLTYANDVLPFDNPLLEHFKKGIEAVHKKYLL